MLLFIMFILHAKIVSQGQIQDFWKGGSYVKILGGFDLPD